MLAKVMKVSPNGVPYWLNSPAKFQYFGVGTEISREPSPFSSPKGRIQRKMPDGNRIRALQIRSGWVNRRWIGKIAPRVEPWFRFRTDFLGCRVSPCPFRTFWAAHSVRWWGGGSIPPPPLAICKTAGPSFYLLNIGPVAEPKTAFDSSVPKSSEHLASFYLEVTDEVIDQFKRQIFDDSS